MQGAWGGVQEGRGVAHGPRLGGSGSNGPRGLWASGRRTKETVHPSTAHAWEGSGLTRDNIVFRGLIMGRTCSAPLIPPPRYAQ